MKTLGKANNNDDDNNDNNNNNDKNNLRLVDIFEVLKNDSFVMIAIIDRTIIDHFVKTCRLQDVFFSLE